MITIEALEELLFREEEVRVIFRAPKSMLVSLWPYKNNIGDDKNLSILTDRIHATYSELPFVIVDGRGITQFRTGIKIGVLRNTYVNNAVPAIT